MFTLIFHSSERECVDFVVMLLSRSYLTCLTQNSIFSMVDQNVIIFACSFTNVYFPISPLYLPLFYVKAKFDSTKYKL